MIKRTQHSLKFITAKKRQLLDALFVEYQRVVNEFIVLYWDEKKLPSKANATQCSSCGVICKESRKGERYECKSCGASLDADHNAGMNIRNRFLNREPTVPSEQKQVSLCNFA